MRWRGFDLPELPPEYEWYLWTREPAVRTKHAAEHGYENIVGFLTDTLNGFTVTLTPNRGEKCFNIAEAVPSLREAADLLAARLWTGELGR